MIVIFTDLDGSLLDAESYSWEAAQPALDRVAELDVPLVLVSSKTRAEIENLRVQLKHAHPFVVENGGAAFLPRGYFESVPQGAVERDGYEVLEWGTSYGELVTALRTASEVSGCPVTGFHEMAVEEVGTATGLAPDQAVLAKQREYDEPFLAPEKRRVPALLEAIERAGFRWTHGGRFYHICGNNDKATAVTRLTDLYLRKHGTVRTIGLGDSLNDLPLLEAVERSVLIRSGRAPSLHFRTIGARYTRGIGPVGWNEAVLELLSEMAP